MRRRGRPFDTRAVENDPALPANATLAISHSTGRFLKGLPLALAVIVRRAFFLMLEDGFAPEFLYIRDKASGRKIARLSLGRDPEEAIKRREIVERDFAILDRATFLSRHVRRFERR
jgi:hypothetical protein